jgi:hypothetical protein
MHYISVASAAQVASGDAKGVMPLGVARQPAAQVVLRRPAAAPARPPAAPVPGGEATGPLQQTGNRAGAARRQYCWLITFAAPVAATIATLGLKSPVDFTRQQFLDVVLAAYTAAGVVAEEAAVFLEMHKRVDEQGNRVPHLHCLVRASTQHAWRVIGNTLATVHKVRVDFGANVRNWYDGIVYGTVASDSKPQEEIDGSPLQWAASGAPVPFTEVLPPKWHSGQRLPKLSPLQAYDMCTRAQVRDVAGVWTLAKNLEREKQRGLLAFLFEHRDIEGFMAKVCMANSCEEDARRVARGRIGLLEDVQANTPCVCSERWMWYKLARETLANNSRGHEFQQTIFRALAEGRKKKTNVFLVGPTNAAKSFLIKPLKNIYKVYEVPDSGTHQLEALLGREVVFLNEFEWDPAWMQWPYLKRFFEGGSVPVARPKNRGGNVEFTLDSPVIGTLSSPIQLFTKIGRNAVVNTHETDQMNSRVVYLHLTVGIAPDAIVECPPCSRCASELYLEGRPAAEPTTVVRDASRSRSPPRGLSK